MLTLQNILTYAEIKGFETQRHLVESMPGYSQELIGFQVKGQHVWHWFKQTTFGATEKHEERVSLFFDHSYSMNTGRTKRGVMHGVDMVLKIQDVLKKHAA